MFEDDMEYVKPSRTRKRSAVLKAVRDPMFKMQTIENKKKVSKERFVDDYHEEYEEYLGEIDDSLDNYHEEYEEYEEYRREIGYSLDDYHEEYEEYRREIDDSLDGDESNYLEVGNE